MKRKFIAGVMGLALAGCAHSRSDVAQKPDPANPIGPVGLSPVPGIDETINRGTGGDALAQTALGDPRDPRWSGRSPAPDGSHAAASPAPAPAPVAAPSPAELGQAPQVAAAGPAASGPPSWSATPGPAAASQPKWSATPTPAESAVARTDASTTAAPAMVTARSDTSTAATPAPDTRPALAAGAPARNAEPLDQLSSGASLSDAAAAAAATMPAALPARAGMPAAPPAAAARGPLPGALPGQELGGLPPAVAAVNGAAATGTGSLSGQPGAARDTPAVSTIPYSLPRPGGPMPDTVARQVGSPVDAATPPPAGLAGMPPQVGGSPDGPPAPGPNLAAPAPGGLDPVGEVPVSLADPLPLDGPAPAPAPAPTDAAVSPSAGGNPPAGDRKPAPTGDPLLGPNPALMPELPPLPDMTRHPTPAPPTASATGKVSAGAHAPAASPRPAPTAKPGAATPTDDLPPLGPATGPSEPPAPASADHADPPSPPGPTEPSPPGPTEPSSPAAPVSPPELGPPSADNRPVGSGPVENAVEVAGVPPLEPVPSTDAAPDARVVRTAALESGARDIRRATARRDGRILRASIQKPAGDSDEQPIPSNWRQASLTAAQVGDEVITIRELLTAVREHCKRRRTPFDELSRDDKNKLAAMILKHMIDQSLLLQEAKHTIKNPKMYDQFTQEADRFWHEDQVPALEIEYHADNEQQLRERLKEYGRSFDAVAQATRQNWMSEAFLHAKIRDRVKVDYPDMRKYYEAHKHDKQNDRPAQIIWREIVVEAAHYPRREDGRRKIEGLYESLRRGADFAKLAKAHSEGPSRSREQGGLMQASPGTYGVPAVNQALLSLPAGQISGILEGPDSFHIVRVDQRREAGPAPFSELQDRIRSTLLDQKYQSERSAFIQKLWDQTPISTIFDGSASDPRQFDGPGG